jgi:ribosomal-protein-alanine N-acetyltransferase
MAILQNENIRLRPIELKDTDRLAEIANNRNISINLRDGFPFPYSETDARNFIQNYINQNPTTLFAIDYEDLYVGNIGLVKGSDVYRKSAEIGYFIGEAFWNKGITTKAVNLATAYGFASLDIERIHTGVFDYNLSSQRVLEKCGFKKEGVCRKAVFKNGKFCDEIRYSKLKKE